ncbi:hypothetical protein [Candidatus Kuenenia stuttgartiensis]|uniref:hypothetical protein n=1 Tax=Kuenenia stuttgartiensis TaxID=174633 RepID=UPI00146A13E7|nr:hypothetical protein [Candidatus Kuenenia stuttgartiensis]
MTKIQTAKLLLILVSIAFCLSNATMGKIITHEHELHFEHGTVHVHHTTGDHGPGETDHKDAKDILSFDYLPANHSNSAKTIHAIKPCLFSRFHFNQMTYLSAFLQRISISYLSANLLPPIKYTNSILLILSKQFVLPHFPLFANLFSFGK